MIEMFVLLLLLECSSTAIIITVIMHACIDSVCCVF
jgi:hypothetical protein